MQALQVDPDLPPKPPASGTPMADDVVHVTLEPLTTEEASRIWALFPTVNYRTSVAYLATPVWIDPREASLEGSPVREDRLRAGSKAANAERATP
jgi:hypothetical protein